MMSGDAGRDAGGISGKEGKGGGDAGHKGGKGVLSSTSQSSERPLRYGLEAYTDEKGRPGRRSLRNKGKVVKYLF